jgi:hypothetical protein
MHYTDLRSILSCRTSGATQSFSLRDMRPLSGYLNPRSFGGTSIRLTARKSKEVVRAVRNETLMLQTDRSTLDFLSTAAGAAAGVGGGQEYHEATLTPQVAPTAFEVGSRK